MKSVCFFLLKATPYKLLSMVACIFEMLMRWFPVAFHIAVFQQFVSTTPTLVNFQSHSILTARVFRTALILTSLIPLSGRGFFLLLYIEMCVFIRHHSTLSSSSINPRQGSLQIAIRSPMNIVVLLTRCYSSSSSFFRQAWYRLWRSYTLKYQSETSCTVYNVDQNITPASYHRISWTFHVKLQQREIDLYISFDSPCEHGSCILNTTNHCPF